MKSSRILLGACALAMLFLSGCAATFGVYDPYPPVRTTGTVVVWDDDYWYDGATYYYYDPGVRLYFWWDSGVRRYHQPYWTPRPNWHRHDGYWRDRDPYWRNHPGNWNRGPARPPVYNQPPRGGWHDDGRVHDGNHRHR